MLFFSTIEPISAERIATPGAIVGEVETEKLTVVALPGTVTLGGTFASDGALLDRGTLSPVGGAGVASLIVPVVGIPPAMSRIAMLNELSAGGGLKGALPAAGNGRYSGSPKLRIIHFNHR